MTDVYPVPYDRTIAVTVSAASGDIDVDFSLTIAQARRLRRQLRAALRELDG